LPPDVKFDFCRGAAQDPAGGAYSAPDPLAAFEGAATSKGGRESGVPGVEGEKVEGIEGDGKGRERGN